MVVVAGAEERQVEKHRAGEAPQIMKTSKYRLKHLTEEEEYEEKETDFTDREL